MLPLPCLCSLLPSTDRFVLLSLGEHLGESFLMGIMLLLSGDLSTRGAIADLTALVFMAEERDGRVSVLQSLLFRRTALAFVAEDGVGRASVS